MMSEDKIKLEIELEARIDRMLDKLATSTGITAEQLAAHIVSKAIVELFEQIKRMSV